MRWALLVVLFLISAPVLAQPGRDSDQRGLTGIEWRLVSLGPAGSEADVVAGTTITLRLGDDGRASGSTGCNSYSGTYEVRGDTISFGRLVSTRRACLDQNANQQEQRFLSLLEAASSFRLSPNRLTVFSDRGRNVLNFVNPAPSEPDGGPRDDRDDPVATLAAYFSAINSKDYRRAYRYWESPAQSFDQFMRGFADTDRVRLLVEPSARLEGAAGSSYVGIMTIIVSTTRGGNERLFAGCYVLRRSNVRDRGWQINRADVSQFPLGARISRLLAQGCR